MFSRFLEGVSRAQTGATPFPMPLGVIRKAQGYLTHGRIDGPAPPKKQKEFEQMLGCFFAERPGYDDMKYRVNILYRLYEHI